jgi:hypothetical protein
LYSFSIDVLKVWPPPPPTPVTNHRSDVSNDPPPHCPAPATNRSTHCHTDGGRDTERARDTGPNNARRVVWAISEFFSFSFHFVLILTTTFMYFRHSMAQGNWRLRKCPPPIQHTTTTTTHSLANATVVVLFLSGKPHLYAERGKAQPFVSFYIFSYIYIY